MRLLGDKLSLPVFFKIKFYLFEQAPYINKIFILYTHSLLSAVLSCQHFAFLEKANCSRLHDFYSQFLDLFVLISLLILHFEEVL